MIQFRYKDQTLECRLEKAEYPHGLGITATFGLGGKDIGKILFLSDRSDDRHSSIAAYNYQDLVKLLEAALVENRCEAAIEKMLWWQSSLAEGENKNISPIYAPIADVF